MAQTINNLEFTKYQQKRGERSVISSSCIGSPDEPPLSQKFVKYLLKISQFTKSTLILSHKHLELFWFFIKTNNPKIKKITTNSLLSFALVTNVLATDAPQTNYSDPEIITGNTESFKQILINIDEFTDLINEKNNQIFNEEVQFIEKPVINKTIVSTQLIKKNNRAVLSREQIRTQNNNTPRQFNGYLYGFCTWYVANIRTDIANNWGNAKYWFRSAKRDGFNTGYHAQVGAIVTTNESWAGHVAYVDSVSDNTITVTEMNKVGWNRISKRVIDKKSSIIQGYIYSQ
ncbi:MAG: LysM protein [uncultured bacterium]|nr:MAG: LysM protein [uncultured bacterium]